MSACKTLYSARLVTRPRRDMYSYRSTLTNPSGFSKRPLSRVQTLSAWLIPCSPASLSDHEPGPACGLPLLRVRGLPLTVSPDARIGTTRSRSTPTECWFSTRPALVSLLRVHKSSSARDRIADPRDAPSSSCGRARHSRRRRLLAWESRFLWSLVCCGSHELRRAVVSSGSLVPTRTRASQRERVETAR
jgi:hypothetical protein